jgi:hypothetical protein
MDESADSSENRKGDSSAEVSATATVLQGGGPADLFFKSDPVTAAEYSMSPER